MLLTEMTDHLGEFETWPTYLLQHLFLDRPGPTRTSRLRKVISFLMETMYHLQWPIPSTIRAADVQELRPLSWWKRLGSGIANGIVRDLGVTSLNIITCFSKKLSP